MQVTRDFYIPDSAMKITSKDCDAVAYIYPIDDKYCAAKVFFGKQAAPVWGYRFPTEEARAKRIAEAFASRKAHKDSIKERRAVQNVAHTFNVGDILYTSRGYKMTFVDFYQIVSLKGKTGCVVRKLSQKEAGNEKSDGWTGHTLGVKDSFVSEDIKVVLKHNGGKIDGTHATEWNGAPKYWNRLD